MIEMPRTEFGKTMHVDDFKKGLKALCPDLRFDPGGNLDLWHPMKDRWQGVYRNDKHLCSMDRGPIIPEFNVYFGENGRCIAVGWRPTAAALYLKGVFTKEQFCKQFKVDWKHSKSERIELSAPGIRELVMG